MLTVPERMKTVTHPMIASMYLKKDYHGTDDAEDVLVIKTNYDEYAENYESFDSYLMKLLGDLNDLRTQAEEEVGKFDRIDIRT
jgi:hypothetical protein